MNNTPDTPAQTPDDHTDQGGNYWALFTPGIWKLLHAVSHTGTSKTCVWRWQQRSMEAGTDGLLIDKTRPSRIPPLDEAVIERVVALTLTGPEGAITHWTAAAVAKACAISVSSVHRIWRRHGLRPH